MQGKSIFELINLLWNPQYYTFSTSQAGPFSCQASTIINSATNLRYIYVETPNVFSLLTSRFLLIFTNRIISDIFQS